MKDECRLSEFDLREIEREYRIYLKLHRHIPGRRCNRETFVLAAARGKLKKNQINRAGKTNTALMSYLKNHMRNLRFKGASYPDPCPDLLKAAKFSRTKSARAVLQWKEKEFTRWVGGPFARAVAMVLAGLEGKPAPSQRQLLRYFRTPGSKNCTKEELAAFRGMIDQTVADIATRHPDPDINELRKNPLFPRD